MNLNVGELYRTRDGRMVRIDVRSDKRPFVYYGALPDTPQSRYVGWFEDGSTPPDSTGRKEYPSDLVAPWIEVDAPSPAGDSTQATTFHALPVRDLMPQETATGVGDVNSDAPGSGARYNTNKTPFELIPLRHIGRSYLTGGDLMPAQERAAKALVFLGDYQSRRRGIGALYDALVVLGFEGWEECARVFDYGRKKYAAWNWAKGMLWSIPLACAARHLEHGILRGEHADKESGLAHRGHVFCNIVMLLAFADTFPSGDDRPRAGLLAQPRELEVA